MNNNKSSDCEEKFEWSEKGIWMWDGVDVGVGMCGEILLPATFLNVLTKDKTLAFC